MNISTTITMGAGEKITDLAFDSAVELADAIMTAVGGDPEKDICSVQVMGSGTVGAMAPLGPMPTVAPQSAPVEESAPKTTRAKK